MGIKTEMAEGEDRLLGGMLEVIRFTEGVSVKLHRVLDEAKIYQVVREEFSKSDRYTVGIMLLDGDGTSLKIVEVSLASSKLKMLEKASGLQAKEFNIKLSDSSICRQVVGEGKTIHANIGDMIREFLPRPIAYLISKTMGYDKQASILTPLHRHGKVIGVLAMSCTDLCEYLIHSVENLALHVTTALELVDEYNQRKEAVQALKRYHDHLGELVEERTAELKAVNEKLLEEITERKQAGEALRESREKFRTMFESVTDGISVVDLNGNIIETNPRAVEMHGFASKDELVGRNALELVAPRDHQRIAANMRRAIKQGTIRGVEYTLLKADGTEFPGELSTSILKDAAGNWVGHITIARDITKRKQAEKALRESEEWFRSIVENSQAGIMILDDAYRFAYVNDELCRISGHSRDELIGQDFRQFLDEGSKELVAGRYIRRQRGEEVPPRYEFNIIKKDGQKRRVEISSAVIKDSAGEVKTVAQLMDITERKRAEEALQAEKNKLQSVIDAMEYSLTIQDKDYNIIYQNEPSRIASGGDHIGEKCYRAYEGEEKVCDGCPVEKAFKDGKSHTSERRTVAPSGEVIFWENTANPIRDAGGKIIACLELARDITERKRAEEALQAEKNKLQSLIGAIEYGLSIQDREYNIIYQNEPLTRNYGDRLGEKCYRVYEGEEKLCDGCPVEKAFKDGKSHTVERKVVMPSGEVAFREVTANPIRDAEGEIVSCLEVIRNITKRKRMEEALADEATRRRILIDQSLDGIVVLDENAKVYEANQRFAEMLGYTLGEVRELHTWDWDKQFPPEKLLEMGRAVDEKGLHLETKHHRKDGSVIDVDISINGAVVAGQKLIFCVCRDITERKQAEEQLQESQKFSSSLLASSPNPITVVNLDTSIRYVNPAFEKLTGFSLDEIAGRKAPYPWWPQGKRRKILTAFKDAVEHGGRRTERNFQRKNGERFWVALNSAPVMQDGKPVYLIISWLDITERKQTEEALQAEKNKLQSLVDAMEYGITIQDKDYNIIYEGKLVETLFGDRRGEKCYRVYEGKEKLCDGCPVEKAFKDGESHTSERRVVMPSGEVNFWENTANPIRDAEGEIVSCLEVVRNITERKQAEEKEKQLQQELYLAQRLASVGELAAGVAHEINNPLTGVLGFSQRLMRKSTDEKVSRDLEIIHNEAQRAADVVQSLLTFARRRQSKKEYANINDVVNKALELRAYALQTGNIEVVTTLAPRLPQIMVDFAQMQEVFLNIILNAEQAMSEAHGKGKLVIKTSRIKGYVRISFADDGPGIPPENLDKVFDPFFTTREEKGGTGLGLSACHGIVTEHGGRIYARSKPGRGATFFVELPLSPAEATAGRRA